MFYEFPNMTSPIASQAVREMRQSGTVQGIYKIEIHVTGPYKLWMHQLETAELYKNFLY